MPTLPVIKSVYPGKEAQGGQRRLSLPRLRLPVQPASGTTPAVLSLSNGLTAARASALGPARPVVLSRNLPLLLSLSKDARLRRKAQSEPANPLLPILRQAQDDVGPLQGDAGTPVGEGSKDRQPLLSPVAFAREVLGVELWDKQVEVLNALTEHRRVAVKAGNGLGKGFCAAVAVLWFIHAHQDAAIALTTAPTFRQVRHILWRQIRRLYRPAAKTLGGDMLRTRWDLDDNRYALGLSADGADQFQGFHSPNMLIVVDEAEGVGEEIYEAIESIMTSVGPLLLLIGNPTSMSGAFRRAFHEERGIYRPVTISALESPNVQAGQIVIPGLTTSQWVEERRQIWGEKSPIYHSRVLGEFPAQGSNTLISLSHIEAATGRPHHNPLPGGEGTQNPLPLDGEGISKLPLPLGEGRGEGVTPSVALPTARQSEDVVIAVDVARFGDDSSVILRRRGDRVEDIQALQHQDTMRLASRVAAAISQHNPACVFIDEIGVGSGVVDRLRQLGHPVHGVNVARKARNDKKFVNLRAEGYSRLRDRFVSGRIYIPDDRQLIAELSSLRYSYDSYDRLKIESKDEIRKRGLPSPDKADALMLAFLPPPGKPRLWT